jgi:hypothetical protein
MTPLPFLDPQGKGCLGSCACIQKDSSDRVEGIFYGKDLIDLPLAKNSKFENRGSSFGPTFLIFGIYFLL